MHNEDFFSIDRLVEFGIGFNVANQMIKMMNESLHNMTVPGADNAFKGQPTMYYAIIDGQQSGPYSECELIRLISDKKIDKSTFMWKPGMTSWKQVQELPDVLKLVALMPPQFNG